MKQITIWQIEIKAKKSILGEAKQIQNIILIFIIIKMIKIKNTSYNKIQVFLVNNLNIV